MAILERSLVVSRRKGRHLAVITPKFFRESLREDGFNKRGPLTENDGQRECCRIILQDRMWIERIADYLTLIEEISLVENVWLRITFRRTIFRREQSSEYEQSLRGEQSRSALPIKSHWAVLKRCSSFPKCQQNYHREPQKSLSSWFCLVDFQPTFEWKFHCGSVYKNPSLWF